VLARSGVERRGVVHARTSAAFLAEAARSAARAAGVALDSLDAVIACSASSDQAMPCNAALLHAELGLGTRGIPAFDVNASCLGFLAGLDVAASSIASGRYGRVLVCAGDLASRALDWSDLDASAIFGDGAAAALVEAGDGRAGIRAARFATYSQGAHLCEIPGGGTRHPPLGANEEYARLCTFRMDGRGLFRLAAEHLDGFLARLLDDAECGLDSLDVVVPHQASRLGLAHIVRRLGLDPERVVDVFERQGNQVSASLPSALHAAFVDGRLGHGKRALLLGTAAGVTLGGAVLDL
jgi:3-oxoacyl-[acyl-carrier-protein] synthase-3